MSHMLIIISLLLGVFAADVFIFPVTAGNAGYIPVLLLALWLKDKYYVLYTGIAATALRITGLLISAYAESTGIISPGLLVSVSGIVLVSALLFLYKKSQEMSKKQHENLEGLFRFAMEGIIVSDRQGIIKMANPCAEQQFGYEPGELIGKAVETLVPDMAAGKHRQHRKDFFKSPRPRNKGEHGLELQGKKKSGELFPVEIGLTHYETSEGAFAVAFIVDATERKKQEADILKANADLKASHEELETFAFVASHDLQEPLRKIQSFGERIRMNENDKLSEQGRDYLARMLNSAARMQRLIHDLLAYSRLSTREKTFTKTNLNDIAKDVLSDLEVAIEKAGAKVQVGELPLIHGDATQMRQLFQNIIANSVKFRKENEAPVIRISSALSESPSGYHELTFEDNGIGFKEQHSERIFRFFERIGGNTYEGSGIGLAVAKKIVAGHNGKISAKSKEGKGSVFTILLPVM